jgi:hypothetical protein
MVEVLWWDAHGGSLDSWTKLGKRHRAAEPCRTVGMLAERGENGITVVLSQTSKGFADAYIFIPYVMIDKFWELQPQ